MVTFRTSLMLICLFQLLSCKTAFKTDDLPGPTSLSCEKVLADKLALTTEIALNSETSEKEKGPEKSAFTERLEKSQCFNQVKWVFQPDDLKNFDRTIKISYVSPTNTPKVIGHTLWVIFSAATLFLVPYHNNFEAEMIIEDSKTRFKKSYKYSASLAIHLFYFFEYPQARLDDQQLINIYDNFITELKTIK